MSASRKQADEIVGELNGTLTGPSGTSPLPVAAL